MSIVERMIRSYDRFAESLLWNKIGMLGATASLCATIAGVVLIATGSFPADHSMTIESRVATLELRQSDLRQELTSGRNATTAPVTEPAISADVRRLETDIANLKTLLLDDPEVTLTIPLLKKDIATLTQQQGELSSRIRDTASLSKWFIGIMLSMSIGLLGLAVGVLVKK